MTEVSVVLSKTFAVDGAYCQSCSINGRSQVDVDNFPPGPRPVLRGIVPEARGLHDASVVDADVKLSIGVQMCLKSGSQLLCKDNNGEPFSEEVSLQGSALHQLLISWTLYQTFVRMNMRGLPEQATARPESRRYHHLIILQSPKKSSV
jgi:hypothetical protein